MQAAKVIADYRAAYNRLNGTYPQAVIQIGRLHRFRVINHNGKACDYTAKDLANITRAALHLSN